MTVTGNASGITGTIYAPGAALSESGNGAINASLIVDTITISGNGRRRPEHRWSQTWRPRTAGGRLDQTTPTTSVGTIPLTMKIKVTDALGNNVSASSLPVVSMSAVGSAGTLVPQTAPGSSQPDNLFTFDADQRDLPVQPEDQGVTGWAPDDAKGTGVMVVWTQKTPVPDPFRP